MRKSLKFRYSLNCFDPRTDIKGIMANYNKATTYAREKPIRQVISIQKTRSRKLIIN